MPHRYAKLLKKTGPPDLTVIKSGCGGYHLYLSAWCLRCRLCKLWGLGFF